MTNSNAAWLKERWQLEKQRLEEEIAREEERRRLEQERYEKIQRHRRMQDDSIWYFMLESSYIRYSSMEKTPSAVLHDIYCRWCEEEHLLPETFRTFCLHLKKNAGEYRIAPTNFIWQGKHIRGFRGVTLAEDVHIQHG